MWNDVLDLEEFYGSTLGQTTARLLRARLRDMRPAPLLLLDRGLQGLEPGGGMPPVAAPVTWEVAADPGFTQVVRRGEVLARPELGHSVHVEVTGLEPDRDYVYRFLAGREAARIMGPRGRGTLIFTGATASLRGREGFSAFAAAKAGLRALAQSLARELGPEGVHVAHVVIDGAVDGTFIRSIRGEVDDLLARDTILKPADVAATYVHLHRQPRSAWTHELDLRPWSETW